jgi:hypothetical protein
MLATKIKQGVIGGIMGGLVFGAMMAKMGMLPMIGKMAGQPNAIAGFLVHMVISAGIGGSFGFLLGGVAKNTVSSLVSGLAYGSLWWVLGPLTLMPLMMGMGLGVNWNAAAASNMLPSLMGHMVFGLVMGFAYSRGDNCLLSRVCGRSDDNSAMRAV